MKILVIGDIVGKGGRIAVKKIVPKLKKEHQCAFCIVNGENIAGGAGLTSKCIDEITQCGVDVITSGDHVWGQKEFVSSISRYKNVLRPANFNSSQPGRGYGIFNIPIGGTICVINLIGRVFISQYSDNPFNTVDKILEDVKSRTNLIFVDFHAEATSEKIAMGHHLDGRVTAMYGTHTHVATADERVLPKGSAYISDIGMVGGINSVIGRDVDSVLNAFKTGMPHRFKVVDREIVLNGIIVDVNEKTGHAIGVQRVSEMYVD